MEKRAGKLGAPAVDLVGYRHKETAGAKMIILAHVFWIMDDGQAPAALQRPGPERRLGLARKEGFHDTLPAVDGLLGGIGDESVVPVYGAEFPRHAMLFHHLDHGAHH